MTQRRRGHGSWKGCLWGGGGMLEVKHRVAQVVCMKTRGQLTGLDLRDEKIVLAKAGVQVTVEASNAYRSTQLY